MQHLLCHLLVILMFLSGILGLKICPFHGILISHSNLISCHYIFTVRKRRFTKLEPGANTKDILEDLLTGRKTGRDILITASAQNTDNTILGTRTVFLETNRQNE